METTRDAAPTGWCRSRTTRRCARIWSAATKRSPTELARYFSAGLSHAHPRHSRRRRKSSTHTFAAFDLGDRSRCSDAATAAGLGRPHRRTPQPERTAVVSRRRPAHATASSTRCSNQLARLLKDAGCRARRPRRAADAEVADGDRRPARHLQGRLHLRAARSREPGQPALERFSTRARTGGSLAAGPSPSCRARSQRPGVQHASAGSTRPSAA